MKIRITSAISIDDDELNFDFVRSSGPGGQNVNKVATAAQLRFNIMESKFLPEEIKSRLIQLAGRKVTSDGILRIDARRFRSQERNRNDAIKRLISLIEKAAKKDKPRKKRKISPITHQKRLDAKRKRGEIKDLRKAIRADEVQPRG